MKDKILLFIPAYNCEKQLIRVLESIKGEPEEYFQRIIVVNNRSTDDTENAALEFKKNNPGLDVRVLRNRENYGLGGSHKVAFNYAVENGFDYVVDVLEPHDPTRQDNLGKAKGFAEYARQNPGVGRIQLIRMQKDSVGQERAFRLDMSKSSVRDKVSRCVSNEELNHIFEDEGFFQ